MAKKNSEKYKDPRKCPDLELWGQKVAFVSPLCPIADPGYTVPKACCAACWETDRRSNGQPEGGNHEEKKDRRAGDNDSEGRGGPENDGEGIHMHPGRRSAPVLEETGRAKGA